MKPGHIVLKCHVTLRSITMWNEIKDNQYKELSLKSLGQNGSNFDNICPSFRNPKIGKQDAANRPKTTDNAHSNSEKPSSMRFGDGNQPAKRPGRQSLAGVAQQPRIITAQPRAKKRLSLPANAQPRIRGSGTTADTVQRPKTASEVRRSSRLAATFSKWLALLAWMCTCTLRFCARRIVIVYLIQQINKLYIFNIT